MSSRVSFLDASASASRAMVAASGSSPGRSSARTAARATNRESLARRPAAIAFMSARLLGTISSAFKNATAASSYFASEASRTPSSNRLAARC